MALQPGQVLNGRYRIVRLLGQGGFGAVYRAWDVNLNRPCAVKENLDTSPEAQRQFTREATVLANLSHPNLPRVTDHFILPAQGQYLVMDYVDGEDLATVMKRQGRVALSQALAWIGQVADALIYLHSRQPPVVHRDIKPANIRVTPEGKAMLVDFGLVKIFNASLRTTLGARAVTPGYAPPEQYGQGATDARTDLYALGATLYTLITAQEPMESVQRMAGGRMPAANVVNPQVPAGLSQTIEQAMAIQPSQRYGSVAEFKTALSGQEAAYPSRPPEPVSSAGPATRIEMPPLGGMSYPVSPVQPQRPPAAEPTPEFTLPPISMPASRPRSGGGARWGLWLGIGLVGLLCIIGIGVAGALLAGAQQFTAQQTAEFEQQRTVAARVEQTSTAQISATTVALQATQTAQVDVESTAVAESTRTALDSQIKSMEANMLLVFGPASGKLQHEAEDDMIESYDTGVNLRDFVVEARFYNPYDVSVSGWDYGFVLRHERQDVQYRFVVRSDYLWQLLNNTGNADGAIVAEGKLEQLDINPGGSNLLRLIFQGQRGFFLLNGSLVSELDLSVRTNAGDILLTTGIFKGDEVTGYATDFSDFTIWQIP